MNTGSGLLLLLMVGVAPPPFPLSAQSLQLGKTSLGHQSHSETAVCISIAFAQNFQLFPQLFVY